MNNTTDDKAVLSRVLDRWKSAVGAHEPQQVAACFTDDAIFQGLHPYCVGRPGIAEYYASQPLGMTAVYRILESRRLSDDLVLGYLGIDFSFADRPTLNVSLGVVVKQVGQGWSISPLSGVPPRPVPRQGKRRREGHQVY